MLLLLMLLMLLLLLLLLLLLHPLLRGHHCDLALLFILLAKLQGGTDRATAVQCAHVRVWEGEGMKGGGKKRKVSKSKSKSKSPVA